MGELGVTGDVIERCLNHVEPNRLRRVYQRQKLRDAQQSAWNELGLRLQALTTTQNSHNTHKPPIGRDP